MRLAGLWIVLAGTLLLSASCAGVSGSVPPPPSAQPARTTQAVAPPSPVSVTSPSPGTQGQPAVDAALRDAAAHLGVSLTDLKVQQVDAREWSDAALGCPRPGLMYAQVLTPGYFVVISGGGKTLEYHTDERGRVVLCQER
jgi:hypothetical protein